jgi:hypothetical protein
MHKRQIEATEAALSGDGAGGLAQAAFLCGQELYSYETVWADQHFTWRFPLLLETVRDRLRKDPSEMAYVFGCSEPQQFSVPAKDGVGPEEIQVLPIPAIVIAFSTTPVPEILGITSVQSSTESIVPMRTLKMSWAPFGAADRLTKSRRARGVDARIFVLHCTMRVRARAANDLSVCPSLTLGLTH